LTADIILQARSTSTRLPGKIFLELHGLTMLEQILIRLKKAKGVRHVCVATIRRDYRRVKEICARYGCRAVWGSEPDVLGRFLKAVRSMRSQIVVRATADNPLVDYASIGPALERFDPSLHDALVVEGLPYGAGFEVVTADALRICGKKARKAREREHVTPYIYEHPGEFRVARIPASEGLRRPDLRVTVDTAEDFLAAKDRYEKYFDASEGTADLAEVVRHESPGKLGVPV
jgi:spore coat polysaccharide biosynthesis protein SpsF